MIGLNRNILKNASWIIGCKIVQSIMTFIIGMITARYLGPSNYGLVNYAASIAAFFLPIMKLGLDATLVQEIINHPDDEGAVIGTSIVMNFLAAIVSIAGISAFTLVADAGDTETIIVCVLYSFTLLFQTGEMIQYWFQSKLLSKYPSIASLIAYTCVSIYKIYILVTDKNVCWFVVTHAMEAAIISLLLWIIYIRVGKQKIFVSISLGKEMFAKSKYYISSGLMVVIFQQTDRIMLRHMFDEAETGYYSAAFTCIGISAFVFSAIIDSLRPSILESKKTSSKIFEKRLILFFFIVTFLSLTQSICMTLLARPIILILFGDLYAPTVGVLQILVWYVVFSYFGTGRNIWILAEGKQKYLWRINLAGAVLNIVTNALLIPRLGAQGAAIATVLSQFFANGVLCFTIKALRPVGKIICRSVNPKYLMQLIKHYKQEDYML